MHAPLAPCHSARAFDKSRTRDAPMYRPLSARRNKGLSRFAVFDNDNAPAVVNARAIDEVLKVQFQCGRENDGRPPKYFESLIQPFCIAALGDNPEVILHPQNLGGSGSKYCFIVRKDYFIHR